MKIGIPGATEGPNERALAFELFRKPRFILFKLVQGEREEEEERSPRNKYKSQYKKVRAPSFVLLRIQSARSVDCWSKHSVQSASGRNTQHSYRRWWMKDLNCRWLE
jgi:hypothetical protein